jgi:uncharacterized membrane protein
MNKQEFLAELKGRLHALDEVEIKKTLAYYGEIIDDRVEEGMTEEQAVQSMEPVGAIAEQILQDAPFKALIRARKPRSLSAGTIVLLVLGSPVWLPLLIAAGVLVLAAFMVIWSLIVALWAVLFAFAVGGVVGIAVALFLPGLTGTLINLGAGLALVGSALLLFQPAILAVRLACRVMVATGRGIKSILIRKEAA